VPNVNRKQLAKALKISVNHVDVLRRDGVIVAINPGEHRPIFDLAEATRSYRAHRKVIDKKRAGSDKLNASALRRWKSRVRIAAQKLAKLKGETDYLVNVQAQWDTIRSAVSKRVKEFPATIAGEVVNVRDAPEVGDILDSAVRELLWTISEDLGGGRPPAEVLGWSRKNPCIEPDTMGIEYKGHVIDIFVRSDGLRSLCIDRHYQPQTLIFFGPNIEFLEGEAKAIIDQGDIRNLNTIACHYSQ
jgi:phage terminase Nu1 subunit (DNA packaging protein)